MVLKKYSAILLLVLAVLAVYAPALRNGFVWDDTALVLRDPLIRSWRLIPEGFNHFLFVDATASDFYRPLQRLTYTIDYALFGVRPGPYHCTNILLHAAAAIALFFFAQLFLTVTGLDRDKSRWIAFTAALVWAVHPVQSAAVAYVSGRADPLAAGFGFFACYLALLASQTETRGRQTLLCASAGAACLLSALSKETGLIFPVLAILLLVLLKQRRVAAQMTLAALCVSVVYLSLRLPAEHDSPPVLGTPAPLAVRPITMTRAVAEYAGLILFPMNLHMDRDLKSVPVPDGGYVFPARRELQTLMGICLISAGIYFAIRMRRRNPSLFILFVLAGVSYLPLSGIFSLNASVAEHWIYVPSAFLFLAAIMAVLRAFEQFPAHHYLRPLTSIAFACWTLFLGGRTFCRTFDWKDQRTFLERTIARGGNSARMLVNLGGLELSEDHLDLAKTHLEEALKKEPDQPFGVINLAVVALKENDFAKARQLLTRATQMPLVEAQAHELLAVLENKERGRANVLRLRLAAHTGPSNWSIEKRYIKLLAETGATAAAIQELRTCLQSEWYRAESWQLLGQLLQSAGQLDDANKAFVCANRYDVRLAARPMPL